MARNGSGTYSLPLADVASGQTILASWANTTLSDIATALTASIAKDGQTVPTATLPMGNFRHTGVGAATAVTDYAQARQVIDGDLIELTSVSGTNTVTATGPLSMSAYATGQNFTMKAAGANTTAVTLNINTIGALAITKNGTIALESGDIKSGAVYNLVHDGSGFQIVGGGDIVQMAKGGDITSASTIVIKGGANYFDVAGTNAVSTMTVPVNRNFFLHFNAALQLTHNATSLDLPGGANITTATGDVAEFFSRAANQVQCVSYTKADGTAVVASAGGGPSVGTDAIIRTNATNIIANTTLTEKELTYTAVHGAETLSRGTDDGFANGDTVQLLNSGGAAPAGWSVGTQYYVVNVASATMQLSTSFGGSAAAISGNGSGTNTVYKNINGMTAGPVTIDSGTVTIRSGCTWNII